MHPSAIWPYRNKRPATALIPDASTIRRRTIVGDTHVAAAVWPDSEGQEFSDWTHYGACRRHGWGAANVKHSCADVIPAMSCAYCVVWSDCTVTGAWCSSLGTPARGMSGTGRQHPSSGSM